MLYLFESDLSENKSLRYALKNVFGIGYTKSSLICKQLGFSNVLKVKNLSKTHLDQLINHMEFINIKLANDLKQMNLLVKKKLIVIKSYRGMRRSRGLPVRGQRTHTNARTSKKHRV